MKTNLDKILRDMNGKKILVIGDLMLDKFIYGNVETMSEEASVPVVKIDRTEYNLGGAGNTANNISSLNGIAFIVGVIGNDNEGETLLKEFKKKNILHDGVFVDGSRPTIQKTRILGETQQMIRMDYEITNYINKELEGKINDYLSKKISKIETIIVSDYAKGTITENIAKNLVGLALKYDKIIVVDTKPKHAEFYRKVTLLKPNLKEAIKMADTSDLIEAGKILKEKFNSNVLITKGKDGMSLFLKDGKYLEIPTKAREVFDVSGAGDTVLATLGLALSANANLEDAVYLANIAGGLVVERKGVVTITQKDIIEYLKVPIISKVWGEEHWLVNESYCGKRLILNKGYRCSLHYHEIKDETFYVAKGKVLLELHGKKIIMNPGDSQRIKPNDIHRFSGLENSEIIEFSTHHDEEDTYRKEPSGKIPEF